MRHIFKCVECGADFEKKDAGVLCEECKSKPEPELAPEPKKKTTKKKGK